MGLRMRAGGVMIALSVLVLMLVSCGPRSAEALAEKMIEKAAARAGEDVDIKLGSDEVKITDKDGNTFTMGSTELPEGWPGSVPFYNKHEIAFASSSKDGGKQAWAVNATYEGPASDVYDFYKKELSGWEISSDTTMDSDGARTYILEATDGALDMTIMMMGEEDVTSVVIALSQQ